MSTVVQYERKFGEIDDLLLRLKGLVLVRGLLAERGADDSTLRKHSDEIRRLREQLAAVVKGRAS